MKYRTCFLNETGCLKKMKYTKNEFCFKLTHFDATCDNLHFYDNLTIKYLQSLTKHFFFFFCIFM